MNDRDGGEADGKAKVRVIHAEHFVQVTRGTCGRAQGAAAQLQGLAAQRAWTGPVLLVQFQSAGIRGRATNASAQAHRAPKRPPGLGRVRGRPPGRADGSPSWGRTLRCVWLHCPAYSRTPLFRCQPGCRDLWWTAQSSSMHGRRASRQPRVTSASVGARLQPAAEAPQQKQLQAKGRVCTYVRVHLYFLGGRAAARARTAALAGGLPWRQQDPVCEYIGCLVAVRRARLAPSALSARVRNSGRFAAEALQPQQSNLQGAAPGS